MAPGILTDDQMLTLLYEPLDTRSTEDSVIWLLGTYYEFVNIEAVEKKRTVTEAEFRGYLKQKLAAYRMKRLRPLNIVF